MRFVRIHVDGSRLDLHPSLTIIAGLDPFAKEKLVNDLSSIIEGEPVDTDVLLEAYGIVLPGNAASQAFLSLQGGVDPVVRIPDLLPGDDKIAASDLDSQIAVARVAVEAAATQVAELKGANHQLESANIAARDRRDDALGRIRELQAAVADAAVMPLANSLATLATAEAQLNLEPGRGIATSATAPIDRLRALQSVEALLHDRLDTSGRLQRDAMLAAAREVHSTRIVGPSAAESEQVRAHRSCQKLAELLQQAGALPTSLDPGELLALTKRWVEERGDTPEPPRELLGALRHCSAERGRMAAECALFENAAVVEDARFAPIVAAVNEAATGFDRYLANAIRLLDATEDLDEAETELGESGPQYGAVVQEIRNAERELMIRQSELDRLTAPRLAEEEAKSADAERSGDPHLQIATRLNNRAAVLRSPRLAGSLPMIVDQALDVIDQDLLGYTIDTLVKVSTVCQVIVISDNPDVADFARVYGVDKMLYLDQALLPA